MLGLHSYWFRFLTYVIWAWLKYFQWAVTFLVFLYVLALCWEQKSKMRAIGVVEAGYGHRQKVGRTEFGIKRSLAAWEERGEMTLNSLDFLVFFLVSMCSEVERFWFVFFELCLGSYGEPMLMRLHCTIKLYVYPYPPIYLFIFVYFGFILFFFFVYIVFFFFWFINDANIDFF